jgi:hypothetical protein
MKVVLIRRLLIVAGDCVSDAAVKELSAFRRLQAAVDAVVFYETATQGAMHQYEGGKKHEKVFTLLRRHHGGFLADEIEVLRQMSRKCSYDGSEIVTHEEADSAHTCAARIQARVMWWFRERALGPLINLQMRTVCEISPFRSATSEEYDAKHPLVASHDGHAALVHPR